MGVRKPSREGLLVIGTYVALVAFNALSEIFRLGGVTAGDVSNEVFAWFAPAGYVFSIWSVIYVGLGIWAVRFAFFRDGAHHAPADRRSPVRGVGPEALWFVASSVLNAVWLVAWHLRVFPLTLVTIVALLVCVCAWYVEERRREAPALDREPVAIYASWLVVAVVANVAHVVTRSATADAGIVPLVSTVLLLLALIGLAYVIRRLFDEYAFGLVLAWAGIGIGVRLLDVSSAVGTAIIVMSVLGPALALLPWDRVRIVRRA